MFNADTFPGKISVGVGAYRDDNSKPWVLPSVAAAQAKVPSDLNSVYLRSRNKALSLFYTIGFIFVFNFFDIS